MNYYFVIYRYHSIFRCYWEFWQWSCYFYVCHMEVCDWVRPTLELVVCLVLVRQAIGPIAERSLGVCGKPWQNDFYHHTCCMLSPMLDTEIPGICYHCTYRIVVVVATCLAGSMWAAGSVARYCAAGPMVGAVEVGCCAEVCADWHWNCHYEMTELLYIIFYVWQPWQTLRWLL